MLVDGLKTETWQSTRGYEKVKPYHIPSIPIIHDRWIPSYVPEDMLTAHLTFPNLVTGYNQIPFRAAGEHFTCDQWNENRERIEKNVQLCLANIKPIKEKLEDLVRQKKKQLEDSLEKTIEVGEVNSKIGELSSILEKTIIACSKMQECKRQLEAFARSIEAPLQISQECLYHRERKDKSELIDDRVEKLLVEETQIFCQSIKQTKRCLQCCEDKLVEGRRYQYDLENCIQKAQWAVMVDRSKEAVDRLLESNVWMKEADSLKNKSCLIFARMDHNRNEADKNIEEIKERVLKIWNETNDAFVKRCDEIRNAKSEIECSMKKIKDEIIDLQKCMKYLQGSKDKQICDELERGKGKLEFLLGIKRMLDTQLSAEMKSLFIDTHACMSMRKSFPISIITDFN
ncbi:tektin-5-like [Phymastichus coffea]|uniref:tektin-5-like n=1 Tax=Phymastichus coffea TaxID=108790 RepID=UPI00273B50DD|nr:tektin-5-like [Phymastichus coffea]